MKETVLIIDDEEELRNLLTTLLKLEGYQVFQAATGREGLLLAEKEEPAVIITDVRLPDISGLSLLPRIKEQNPRAEVIVLTAYGTIEDGVQAIKEGAFDYITKGDEDNKIVPVVHRAMEKARMRLQIEHLQRSVGQKYHFDNIIGNTASIRQAIETARKAAETDVPVLLLGETGTGKEIFAQAIHHAGSRKEQAFIAINCSAFARDLLESEMFGYKAGAFTGATKNKKGLFEEAHKGTLFLDEIGDLDLALQAKLLRALEEQSFIKAGDTKPTRVDVRLIAATNRNLEKEIEAGNFRVDLYYRIGVMKIELPALRERPEDIPLFAEYFIRDYARKMKRKITEVSPVFLERLKEYSFPGNIRELRNVIERAVILSEGQKLAEQQLPREFFPEKTHVPTTPEESTDKLEAIEKQHILKILQQTGGNKTRAAELLGIGLTTLYRKLQRYGIG
ncbi:MAG: sigma-54-dependent Fis family transcriptional regulator [Calditrichaceae bacterium]|nr:sigma-54 dependent transcriptional regulator [Calditrichia bacterium]NUQ41105.1 sigma-54-dependent Fis family transcriptional regulator [Calditrichaceae bacterium]